MGCICGKGDEENSSRSDTRQKYPLTTQGRRGGQDFQGMRSAARKDSHTSALFVRYDPAFTPPFQPPPSKIGPRKFCPSFLATSAAINQSSANMSPVKIEQADTIVGQHSQSVQFADEPGKRWYN